MEVTLTLTSLGAPCPFEQKASVCASLLLRFQREGGLDAFLPGIINAAQQEGLSISLLTFHIRTTGPAQESEELIQAIIKLAQQKFQTS